MWHCWRWRPVWPPLFRRLFSRNRRLARSLARYILLPSRLSSLSTRASSFFLLSCFHTRRRRQRKRRWRTAAWSPSLLLPLSLSLSTEPSPRPRRRRPLSRGRDRKTRRKVGRRDGGTEGRKLSSSGFGPFALKGSAENYFFKVEERLSLFDLPTLGH